MTRSLAIVVAFAGFLLGGDDVRHRSPPAAFAAHAATPASTIDRGAILAVIRKHAPDVRRCYQEALATQPKLVGRMVVRLTIAPTGRVSSVAMVSSTLQAPAMEECVLTVVQRMVFPRFSGADVTIRYPFVFTSAS